jgi:hypothetical protein
MPLEEQQEDDEKLNEERSPSDEIERIIFSARMPKETADRIKLIKDGWNKSWPITFEVIIDILSRSGWVGQDTISAIIRSRKESKSPYGDTFEDAIKAIGGTFGEGDITQAIHELREETQGLREEMGILGRALELHAETVLLADLSK